jgi:hypothetical protein
MALVLNHLVCLCTILERGKRHSLLFVFITSHLVELRKVYLLAFCEAKTYS